MSSSYACIASHSFNFWSLAVSDKLLQYIIAIFNSQPAVGVPYLWATCTKTFTAPVCRIQVVIAGFKQEAEKAKNSPNMCKNHI